MKALFYGMETTIQKSLIAVEDGEQFDIDFNGGMLVRFEKQGEDYVVCNAVDGWGDNCYGEVENEKLTIIE